MELKKNVTRCQVKKETTAKMSWQRQIGEREREREREEHKATNLPFRDSCAHCMMGRGRTHHHVAKQKSQDQSRRHIFAMDYFFMKMESAPNVQAISEESSTCVAVKEDRHQNIMSSVALKNGNEEPWTIERVVKFVDLLGYREITLKSDTEPATIAFRNRVAAMCKAEVTTEDAVKGDRRVEWAHRERGDVDSWNYPDNQVPYRKQDARTTQRRLACHTMAGGARRMHPAQVPERS